MPETKVDAVLFTKPCKGGCGMPLYWNQKPGTKRDKSRRNDYCSDCEARLEITPRAD
jgi:hypothetical protein